MQGLLSPSCPEEPKDDNLSEGGLRAYGMLTRRERNTVQRMRTDKTYAGS